MARVTWWILPIACVVMAKVMTLDGSQAAPSGAAEALPPAAPSGESHGPGPVVLRDATGARHAAVVPGAAFAVQLPTSAVGARVELTLERVEDDGGRSPWITGTPRVPTDGVLRFAGLPAGVYAVRVRWGSGDGAESRAAERCEVPGSADLTR